MSLDSGDEILGATAKAAAMSALRSRSLTASAANSGATSASASGIKIDHFTKIYGRSGQTAVSDFSLECQAGQITGIMGPNGSGKTTILKAVTARHFPSSGSLSVNGINPCENPERVRQITGFVEEQASFPSFYTVKEFLFAKAELFGVKKNTLSAAVKKACEVCSLDSDGILSKKIPALSKGYKTRLAFASALVYNPPVLVLDESANGLDPEQIAKMRSLILSLKKNHTILLSTHLMQEAHSLCDKICFISHGQKKAFGTEEDLKKIAGTDSLEDAFFKLTGLRTDEK